MKKILTILLLSWVHVNATTYHFAASGNDANSGTIASPMQTLTKVNSLQASLVAGDSILFNRGDSFYGNITLGKAGSAGSPIVYGAYGTGAQPIITGLTTITAWTSLGGNIWESNSAVSTLSTCNLVLINGVNTPICRIPNSGYWTVKKNATSTQIVDSTGALVASGLNFVGAQLCLRSIPWMLEVNPITAQSSSTLTYSGGSSTARQGFGYFIQNDSLLLDAQNEWWFSTYTKKVRMYSTSSPTGVQIPTIDTLVNTNGQNYITFDNIDFEGSNMQMIRVNSNTNLIVQNCKLQYGERGLGYIQSASSGETVWSINNTFKNLNNHAMYFGSYSATDSIYNCTIDSIGMIPGSWFETDQNSGDAIRISGPNSDARFNTITHVGHHGIYISQSNGLSAQYNLIKYWGMSRYDAGGIYTFNNDTSVSITRRLIDHNIIDSSNQVNDGIAGNNPALWGVYLDGKSRGQAITYNIVRGALTGGIHVYDAGYDTISNNLCYDNAQYQLGFVDDLGSGTTKYSNFNHMVIKHNYAIAKDASQLTLSYRNDRTDFTSFGVADSNYYARPIDDNSSFATLVSSTSTSRTLSGWQTLTSQDAHSNKSAKTITTTSDIRLDYNATNASVNASIPWYGETVVPEFYNGVLPLGPYTGKVTMNAGTIISGSNSIKLPGNKRIK